MQSPSYIARRGQLLTYFDRTAVEAWARLTSEAPISKIRATVRAGRNEMRDVILGYLPRDLAGARLLDAGCGTGALAAEAAARGADVVAVDLSPKLVDLARDRSPTNLGGGRITYLAGDMLDPALGRFDYVVAMDSLIHYRAADMASAVTRLAERTEQSLVFTFAPRTLPLTLMHAAGKAFPRGDRSPAIEPVAPGTIQRALVASVTGRPSRLGRTRRVSTGFYISQAQEVVVA